MAAVCIVAVMALVWAMVGTSAPRTGRSDEKKKPLHDDSRIVSKEERIDALARAHVWRRPHVPIARARLGSDGRVPSQIDCHFTITDLGGTTPKFHCVLDTGDEIRAKYGPGGELPAEAAATRLLTALGFGADSVTLVERLRCYGCPREPFVTGKIVEATGTQPLYERVVDHGEYREFAWAAVEQKLAARPIETQDEKGWAFFELAKVDESKGGAPRAHVDALRLIAVFLAHWDNKSENQRLVCLSDPWIEGTPCAQPFLLMQDVGATFGPRKVDLEAWEKAMVWENRAACTIAMRDLPYDGGTFGSARISEGGRQFFLGLVAQLSDAQLTDLFSAARFDDHGGVFAHGRPVYEWVRVFKSRVKTISDGPPCPQA